MSDPQKYTRTYSFTDYQAGNPSAPLPGIQVDNELENVEQSLDEAIDAIKDVRRSDGALKNGIVTVDSLADATVDHLSQYTAANTQAAQAAAEAAEGSATAAATSAGQAMTYRNEASTQKTLAQTARTGAQDARDYAAAWATAAEDVDVDDGVNPVGKSSYHWAMVAENAVWTGFPENPTFTRKGTFYANNSPGATFFRASDRAFFGSATTDTGHDTRASRRITSLTRSGTTATVVCENSHDMSPGDAFSISGVSQAEYNGSFTVLSVTNSTTFTYAVSGSPATPATAITGRYMRMDQATNGVESWLEQMRVNTVRGSVVAILADKGMSPLATGTRTSDMTGNGYAVGPQFWAMNDAGVAGRYAWAFYAEARRYPGSSFTVTTEWDIANYGNEVEFPVYGHSTVNMSGQLWLASGGDPTTAPYVPNAASFGVAFINNGAKYLTGIAFASDALAAKTVGPLSLTSAMKLGIGMMFEWFNSSNQRTAFITSRVNSQTAGTSLHFTDGGLYVMDYSATNILLRVQGQSASAVNGIRILSTNTGNSPVIDPHDGGDANVDINLRGRGTGSARITDPSGNARVAVNSTGLSFFGAAPVAKPTVSGSRGGNAAVASLLSQLATLGLITDSTTA